jgi:hypothetical protein
MLGASVLPEDKVRSYLIGHNIHRARALHWQTLIYRLLFPADNDMINGTKLLNVVGMSRGKRDGILKNEKGRVVVKVGSMHLKGVW